MTVRWIRRIVQLAAPFLFGWLLYQSRWTPTGGVQPAGVPSAITVSRQR